MKIPQAQASQEFGRVLYLLGLIYASEKQFIKSEGLFRTAIDFYDSRFSYEKVESLMLYSQVLNQIDIRKSEAEDFSNKAKETAAKMPYWYPYMVNLAVPKIEFIN